MKKYFQDIIYFIKEDYNLPYSIPKANQAPTPDQNINNPNSNPNLNDFPEEEDTLTFSEIGKVYILKKIYIRLLAIDRKLLDFPNPKFDKIKNEVKEAIEIFHTMVSNIDKIKKDLDKYIRLFQEFIIKTIKTVESLGG
jgi:hypothetical protein